MLSGKISKSLRAVRPDPDQKNESGIASHAAVVRLRSRRKGVSGSQMDV